MGFMLSETTILILVGLFLGSLFGMTALKMWYSLRVTEKSQNQIKVLQAQVRGNANKIQAIKTTPAAEGNSLDVENLAAMPDKDMMELLGIDEKTYRLAKPFIGKILNRLGGGGGEGQADQGGAY